jgi:mono/diheme cytochrome c family protein
MKKRCLCILATLGVIGSVTLTCLAQTPGAGKKAVDSTAAKNTNAEEGERRFRQNCGRCHNPPDSLSPREVKAVLQQMRVRAMLTAEDERLIMKYLAP